MTTCLLFAILSVCFGSIVYYSLHLGISPMPSSGQAKNAMVQLLPNRIENGVIYELGSGWGGLAFLLAERYPEAKIIALELSPLPYLFSRSRQFIARRPNLKFAHANFYEYDLSNAKAVVCYLFPDGMKKLAQKLKNLQTNSSQFELILLFFQLS